MTLGSGGCAEGQSQLACAFQSKGSGPKASLALDFFTWLTGQSKERHMSPLLYLLAGEQHRPSSLQRLDSPSPLECPFDANLGLPPCHLTLARTIEGRPFERLQCTGCDESGHLEDAGPNGDPPTRTPLDGPVVWAVRRARGFRPIFAKRLVSFLPHWGHFAHRSNVPGEEAVACQIVGGMDSS